jgi:uncharacterized repeat protein (TIGR01451 family)
MSLRSLILERSERGLAALVFVLGLLVLLLIACPRIAIGQANGEIALDEFPLTIAKTVMPDVVGPGEVVTYTIWITHATGGLVQGVTITDALPPGFDPPQKVWSGLAISEPVSLTLAATTPVTEGIYYNSVTWATDGVTATTGPTAPVRVVTLRRIYLPQIVRDIPVSWHQGEGTDGLTAYSVAGCPADCAKLYAGTQANGVYKSQDGGRTWAPNGLAGARVNWLAVQPDDCEVAHAATWGLGVQKTTDGGLHWTPANAGLADLFLYILAVAPDGQTLYVGTAQHGVYKSTDAGGSWSPANAGLPGGALVDALAIDADDPQIVYAGTWGQGVYKTTTAGGSWSPMNNDLGDPQVYAVALDPGDSQVVYASTFGQGVYRSGDAGASWTEQGLAGRVAYSVVVDEDGVTYAGTDGMGDGNGVYQRSTAGAWQAMAKQPGVAPVVRNLALCGTSLLAGTTDGAWWYGPD